MNRDTQLILQNLGLKDLNTVAEYKSKVQDVFGDMRKTLLAFKPMEGLTPLELELEQVSLRTVLKVVDRCLIRSNGFTDDTDSSELMELAMISTTLGDCVERFCS